MKNLPIFNEKDLKVGDIIVFKSPTLYGAQKAKRIVNGFTKDGQPTVRFNGWSRFVVRYIEIVEVLK